MPYYPLHPTENLAYTLLEDKSGYEVSKGTANLTGTIVILSTYNGLPVKQIAEKAFSYFHGFDAIPNTKTTGVVIPDTVETISSFAFFNSGLTEIELQSSLKKNLQSVVSTI